MPPHLIFGAGGIGTTAKSFTFTWDTPEKVSELLALLQKLEIKELDSAASYPPGNPWNTETLLGQSKAAEKEFIIDSKVAAFVKGPQLDEERIAESIDKTLQLLGTTKIRTLYAHGPDNQTPLEVTAAAFHKQYEAGKFERLGLCNYKPEDMAKYFAICDEKGYVKPAVYQGHYNALARSFEDDLFPLLRKNNCVFYAYSPLAGGFLTGKVTFASDSESSTELTRTRWRGESVFPWYVHLFDRPAMHDAIRKLKATCDAAEPPVSLQEAAMRWIVHHSALRDGDGVIFGAKRVDQLEANVLGARKGPLPEAVVAGVEALWGMVKDSEPAHPLPTRASAAKAADS